MSPGRLTAAVTPRIVELCLSDVCPDCGSPSRVVVAVSVPALRDESRPLLVTRQCTAQRCQLKFPVFKKEGELSEDERRVWTRH